MKNKVFIVGLITSICIALLPVVQAQDTPVTIATVGFAALTATLSYFADKWRGQTSTILGLLGNVAGVAVNMLTSGAKLNEPLFYVQLVLQAGILYGAMISPDPKSVGYEHTDTITRAKKEGEAIQPAQLTNKGD